MNPPHIAVVDDEADIATLLAHYLRGQGYRVTPLASGAALMDLLASDPPELVLLDLGLPGEDGFAVARALRQRCACGLIIVSGRGDAIDKVVGLEIGADDYVTKPFDLRELLARIKAVARRLAPAAQPEMPPGAYATPTANPVHAAHAVPMARPAHAAQATVATPTHPPRWQFATWTLDLGARRLDGADGREMPLTSGEFDLLSVFVAHPGRVLSRDFLLESTRGRSAAAFDRSVDVQVGRLRKKLEADANEPQLIKSVRNAGYILVAPVSPVLPAASPAPAVYAASAVAPGWPLKP